MYPYSTPEKISYEIPLPNSIIKYSSDGYHTCAVTIDHKLYCFGENQKGQIGNNSTTDKKTPVLVLSDVSSFGLGDEHTCAIKLDGTLWCWGDNTPYGQVGMGSGSANILVPTKVLDDVSVLPNHLGYYHTCTLKTNGNLYCWGGNSPYGQVGVGYTNKHVFDPTKILSDVIDISNDEEHTCAVQRNGDLYCWGFGQYGQVGYGGTAAQSSPVQIMPGTKFRKVKLEDYHSCAITRYNVLYCWGGNTYGFVGIGNTTTPQKRPQYVTSDVDKYINGNYHSCVIKTDNTLWCWGGNGRGQVGNNSTANVTSPTQILPSEALTAVVAGDEHTCALTEGKELYCWDLMSMGRLVIIHLVMRHLLKSC